MYLAGFSSINKWIKELKDTPRYAYLSCFDPEKTPSKAYFSWITSNLFGKNMDIDDIMTQGTLLKKISEATRGYDHNLDEYLMGYGLHFAVTPFKQNKSIWSFSNSKHSLHVRFINKLMPFFI